MKIRNILGYCNAQCEVDLKRFSETVNHTYYDPWEFPACRMKTPNWSALIYSNGKIVIAGAKSIENLDTGFNDIFDKLKPLCEVKNKEWTITNIVAEFNLKKEIDLDLLEKRSKRRKKIKVVYTPETFPGATVRIKGHTFQVFKSGKIICLGCTSLEEVENAKSIISEVIT